MRTAQDIISMAIEQAGSNDFGGGDIEAGLERMIAGFAQVPLTEEAEAAAEAKFVHDLATRLRIEQYYADRPDIADTPVEAPVLVCGLPRTGTTATVGMMALDDRFRFLRMWEAVAPLPPPRIEDEATDPRAVAAREAADYSAQAQHISDPDGPEEDLAMLAGYDCHSFHGAYPMPQSFLDWWKDADFSTTYAFHRKVLTLLHSHRPPHRWLLKAPPHIFHLDDFAREYPDARFIMTHRDPAKIIGSVCSLNHRLYTERCKPGSWEKTDIGPQTLKFWAEGIERAMAARAQIGEDRFVDVWNDDVVRDAVGTFEKTYAALDMEISDDLRARIQDYATRNAKGSKGAHRYTAEEYGLTDAGIRDAFGAYIDRFNL